MIIKRRHQSPRRYTQLAELLEQATARMQRGERDKTDDPLVSPDSAKELGELMPVLQLLGELQSEHEGMCHGEGTEARDHDSDGMELDDFRIVGEIGRGGMGVIYEADQLSLGRRVALKVLPFTASLDGNQLRRFDNEARAMAGLDHANIVPVYSVGSIQHVHYYAMQLIKGRSLATLIALMRQSGVNSLGSISIALEQTADEEVPRDGLPTRNNPSPRSYFSLVAELGIQAADALQYAHESGVVHRDVKPSNLLVTEDGHLWVTDFGLARIADQASLTVPGDVVGTLRYMSPEQALGGSLIVDHRTDIYSLGVTLYELLTLQPAFAASDRRLLLKQISSQEPRPPRQIDNSIPRDLETITLKAMADQPQERYPSARELAVDLRRFLENKPILARRATLVDRAVKVARRNAPAMWAAFLVLAVTACALTVGTIMLMQQRNMARTAAQRERQLAGIALRQQSQAQSERHRAESNFLRAREAVDRMLHTATYELAGVGKSDRIRRDLMEDALEFYQSFLQQQPDDDSVRRDLAVAYTRVGEIHHRLGNNAESANAFRHARELSVELVASQPSAPELRMDLATVLNKLAHVRLEESDLPDPSEDLIQRQIQLLNDLVAEYPAEASYRYELAIAQAAYGNLLVEMGRLDEAEALFRQSLAIWELETSDVPKASRYAVGAAHTHHALGSLLLSTSRHKEAGWHLFEAWRLRGEPREASEPQLEYDLAHLEQDLATFLCKTGDRRGAKPHLRRAIAICEKLVANFPAAVDYSYRLAVCNFDLYRVLLALQDEDQAHKALALSSVYLEKITDDTNRPLKYILPLARNYYIVGLNSHVAGDAAAAEQDFRRALQLLETGLAKFPGSSGICSQLAWLLATCPDDRFQDAGRAVQLAHGALELEPQNASHQRVLGAALYRAGAWDASIAALDKVCELKQSGDGFDWFLFALAHAGRGNLQEANQWYRRAQKWMQDNPCDAEQLTGLQREAERHVQAIMDKPATSPR